MNYQSKLLSAIQCRSEALKSGDTESLMDAVFELAELAELQTDEAAAAARRAEIEFNKLFGAELLDLHPFVELFLAVVGVMVAGTHGQKSTGDEATILRLSESAEPADEFGAPEPFTHATAAVAKRVLGRLAA